MRKAFLDTAIQAQGRPACVAFLLGLVESLFGTCCTLMSICYRKIKFIKIRGCNDGNDMLICIRIKNNVAEILRIKTIKLRG